MTLRAFPIAQAEGGMGVGPQKHLDIIDKTFSEVLNAPSPYYEFYEEQVRYAFRVIAREREEAYLWDSWKDETEITYNWT